MFPTLQVSNLDQNLLCQVAYWSDLCCMMLDALQVLLGLQLVSVVLVSALETGCELTGHSSWNRKQIENFLDSV